MKKTSKTRWTRFMDMHSGGGQKEKWAYIYIEAPEDEAKVIFYNRFGHNPERVTCTCCGEDYSIGEHTSLAQATAYNRNCDYKGKRYVEVPRKGETLKTVRQYIKDKDVLVIYSKRIKPAERVGSVPVEGYVWMG
jgi:hypothetical protein